MKEFVYILSHARMPGIVKIGYSNESDRRMECLSTSVPNEFVLEQKFETSGANLAKAEKKIHRRLDIFRIDSKKEFFELGVKAAKILVDDIIKEDTEDDSEPINEDIGEQIKALRKDHGLTQSQLAKMADISTITLQRIESGSSSSSFNVIQKVLSILGYAIQIKPLQKE